MTNVSIICPTYRNPRCLDIFLRSATENRTLEGTEIICIVDGYAEESREVLDKYKDILVLELPENKGMQTAINYGVWQASNEAIFVVNDDNVFGEDYDAVLCDLMDEADNVVFTINQIERSPGIFNFEVKDFGNPDNFDYDAFLAYEPKCSKITTTPDGNIFPFLMSKKWFMAVGGFDTFYDSPNVCDLDFFLKLELADLLFSRSRRIHLYHFGSVATKQNKDRMTFTAKEQAAHLAFEWKWGMPAAYYANNSKIPPNAEVVRGVRLR
jgi:glycosyltransferase involved in cell wall biosynthesis